MTRILHIQTALEDALVTVSTGPNPQVSIKLAGQKEHASLLHPGIRKLLSDAGLGLGQLDAIAVVNGPGSYTGLRVGMAAAKGLCLALDIPLLTVNTLEWMATAVEAGQDQLICPMIDARRDEVFTALYTHQHKEIMAPCAMALREESFGDALVAHDIYFIGSGRIKFSQMTRSNRAKFIDNEPDAIGFCQLALDRYNQKQFSQLSSTEPFYAKAFFSTAHITK